MAEQGALNNETKFNQRLRCRLVRERHHIETNRYAEKRTDDVNIWRELSMGGKHALIVSLLIILTNLSSLPLTEASLCDGENTRNTKSKVAIK